MLYEDTYERGYFETAFLLNGFARRTLILNTIEDVRGGVKGSFPIYGDYGKFELLNWACQLLIGSNTLELSIRNREFDSGRFLYRTEAFTASDLTDRSAFAR